MTDVKQLLHLLSTSKVDFILVGGMAATVHGATRLTQDLDIVYSRSRANLERLVAASATKSSLSSPKIDCSLSQRPSQPSF